MNNELKYSIVMPTYNEEKDIGDTVKHLLSLDYDNYNIIIGQLLRGANIMIA